MDPLTGAAAVAKAGDSEAGKATVRLVERMLGPSADVIGQALASWTDRRLNNIDRIVKKAGKRDPVAAGPVNPRVAHRLLEEGSYVEDEVMAEYLAGVLASSKAEGGNDDRGVPITSLIASMSSEQVRAHFILYRTWVGRAVETKTSVAMDSGRGMLSLRADIAELVFQLGEESLADGAKRVGPILSALERLGLIAQTWSVGPREDGQPEEWWGYLSAEPSLFGVELYGWALGEPDFELGGDLSDIAYTELDPSLPGALTRVLYPRAVQSVATDQGATPSPPTTS